MAALDRVGILFCISGGTGIKSHAIPGVLMPEKGSSTAPRPIEIPTRDRLDSWKEIASYLKCSERTVRRWEQEGLPVHRHLHKKKAAIYAYGAEIDAWWKQEHQRLQDTEQAPGPSPWRRRRWVVAGLTLALVTGAAAFLVRGRLRTPGTAKPIRIESLAVLPLENLSRDADQEYFADGMTDELITDLAQIHALRVISRNSVMQYKSKHKPAPEIARELNVDAIVEGTVMRSGDHVRITARLIEAAKDRHLWADSYERDLHDVLQLQDDLAKAIANQVEANLTSQEQLRVASSHAASPQAYELYLKGRYFWEKRNKPDFVTSLDYFQRAIDLDPHYASAYAGMAEVYGLLGNNGFVPANEVYPKAKAAALKALELDPNLADAHTSLAEIINDYDWDWTAAEKEYRRAIELDSNDATAHHWYAMTLAWQGRFAEAIPEIEKARQLDPLSMRINTNIAQIFFWARDNDRALLQCQKALELHPNAWGPHRIIGLIFFQRGVYQAAIDELLKAVDLAPGDSRALAALAYGYAATGEKQKAISILRKLEKSSESSYVSPTELAIIYAGLSRKDEAFAYLEKAISEHDTGPEAMSIKVEPALDSLRSDPRFSELLLRRGLK
jgi:TolB-like protein/Tfp pilus assembly protein PilF